MGSAAARSAKIDLAVPGPSFLELGLEIRIFHHFIAARKTAMPITRGKGDQPATRSQTCCTGPTDETVVARILFWLIAPRPDEHPTAFEVSARSGLGAGFFEHYFRRRMSHED